MEYHSEDNISNPTSTVYSNTIFLEITKGTDFEDDKRMRKHLDVFSNTFVAMIETEDGIFVLQSLEETVKLLKDKQSFVSAVQLTSKLVTDLDINPTERFSLFLGGVGIIIALVSHPGPATILSTELENIISQTYELILCTALVPFWNGTKNSIENFFFCEFVQTLGQEK